MDPPAPRSTVRRAVATPDFRNFVTVELPFTLTPESADATQHVSSFLPPAFVVDFVQRAAPKTLPTVPADDAWLRETAGTKLARASHTAASPESDASSCEDDASDHHSNNSGSSRRSSNGDSSSDEFNDGTAAAVKASPEQRRRVLQLQTSHRRAYCAEPIFSGWRSTNWDGVEPTAQTASPAAAAGRRGSAVRSWDVTEQLEGGLADAADEHQQRVKQQRRENFPSIEPQLLINGYYRNDLLVQVRRSRRIRRYRDVTTDAILQEEVLAEETGEDGQSNTSAELSASVVGVVSRELELARPADFTFGLFAPAQLQASPSLCGADVFPPAHYISERAIFEVRYEPGREVNTSVPLHEAGASEQPSQQSGDAAAAQSTLLVLPAIAVKPEETVAALPTRLPAHEHYLRSLSSSLDGSREDDPPEVRHLVQLLAERPAWTASDLVDAMLLSGYCPRSFRNRQVIACFTYLMPTGPFNRMRLRLGYDPYADSSSVKYQSVTVYLKRRSEVGMRLRDIWRSPYTESVLRQLLERERERRAAYKAQPGHARRATLLELQCRAIRVGMLYMRFQLVDAMDDAVIADLVGHVAAVEGPMPAERRGQRSGWLSEAAYTRAATYWTEALERLLTEEVEPLVRKMKQADAAAAPSHSPKKPEEEAEEADEEADDDDNDSAMSSATAGDLSSDGEVDDDDEDGEGDA